jgi:hypothetical protein
MMAFLVSELEAVETIPAANSNNQIAGHEQVDAAQSGGHRVSLSSIQAH